MPPTADAAGNKLDRSLPPRWSFIPGEKADGEPLNKDKCMEGHVPQLCDGEGLQVGVASVIEMSQKPEGLCAEGH